MSDFEGRIERTAGSLGPTVQLTERELELYSGSGWAVLEVEQGNIVKIDYLADIDDIEKFADGGTARWLAMLSSTEAVEPVLLDRRRPETFARLARVWEESR